MEAISQEKLLKNAIREKCISRIKNSIESGNTQELQETMDFLAEYLVTTAGKIPTKHIGELDILNAEIEKFKISDFNRYPAYSFMRGSEGERIFFRNSLMGNGLELHYGKPSNASYPNAGKFWEAFVDLFGSEDVSLAS